jgi:hypothetical protein
VVSGSASAGCPQGEKGKPVVYANAPTTIKEIDNVFMRHMVSPV